MRAEYMKKGHVGEAAGGGGGGGKGGIRDERKNKEAVKAEGEENEGWFRWAMQGWEILKEDGRRGGRWRCTGAGEVEGWEEG